MQNKYDGILLLWVFIKLLVILSMVGTQNLWLRYVTDNWIVHTLMIIYSRVWQWSLNSNTHMAIFLLFEVIIMGIWKREEQFVSRIIISIVWAEGLKIFLNVFYSQQTAN